MYKVLSEEPSLLNDYLEQLRDVNVQKDRMRFRRNVERIGEIMAYEVSKLLPRHQRTVTTPLGQHTGEVLSVQPVLATVLRAGLAMHQGFLSYFDAADNAYVSAYRKHGPDHTFEIVVEYLAAPPLEGRPLILIDPMLATGRSMHLTYKALRTKGTPSQVIVVGLIGSTQGVEYIQRAIPEADLLVAAVDPSLDVNSYIVPGLGDAGDLSFGEKL